MQTRCLLLLPGQVIRAEFTNRKLPCMKSFAITMQWGAVYPSLQHMIPCLRCIPKRQYLHGWLTAGWLFKNKHLFRMYMLKLNPDPEWTCIIRTLHTLDNDSRDPRHPRGGRRRSFNIPFSLSLSFNPQSFPSPWGLRIVLGQRKLSIHFSSLEVTEHFLNNFYGYWISTSNYILVG